MHVPAVLSVRLRDDARAHLATIAASINAPHRRPVTLTDAFHAALAIAAAGAVESHEVVATNL